MKLTRKQTTPNFPKNEHFFSTDTHMRLCVSGGKKCSLFRKIWRGLFSCYLRFEIRLFDLLMTNYSAHLQQEVKAALLKRGYIYVSIEVGIAGNIQINDTDLQDPLKAKHHKSSKCHWWCNNSRKKQWKFLVLIEMKWWPCWLKHCTL